ncbi:MAG: RluA family pseudouridine synthase [Treponemataceae bacterium]|nr:RluA family pseudouridine synthase [Treponemataceae bacterium]
MFPPFPEEEALAVCRDMAVQLDAGILELEQLTPESAERGGQGIMLGAMVCRDSGGRTVLLKTVSGISRALRPAPGLSDPGSVYVPPVADAAKISRALAQNDGAIHALTDKINACKKARRRSDGRCDEPGAAEAALRRQRAALTAQSLDAVFSLYSFHCADGCVRSLREICGRRLPPVGTGDCCAPKLLDYAFARSLVPVSMGELYYGRSSGPKRSGTPYPPCDARCALILPRMLGLHIVYRDDDILVVEKEGGVLSVPGRGPEKQDCVVNRMKRLFPAAIGQPAVHRLDMETSGLLVLAFTADAHRELCRQFEKGRVRKRYSALLDGVLDCAPGLCAPKAGQECGRMELYFRLDVGNRPHQVWDSVFGKKAVTEWKKTAVQQYRAPDGSVRPATRISFTPHTGRTHQLRLASADLHGFGIPIVGDSLYGSCAPGERLLLHAEYLAFTHPRTGAFLEFKSPPPF